MTSRMSSSKVTAAALLGFSGFQAGLAAGMPWGRAAYGGLCAGVLPPRLRMVSGGAAGGYAALAAVVAAEAGSPIMRRRILTGIAVVMAGGVPLNLASRSAPERIWGPVCGVTAVAAWRAARALRSMPSN